MPTGACGIDCDVCKLKLQEICSTCGPGKSIEAKKKLEAQKRLIGDTCPILSCANMTGVDYCLRDCSAFPCDNFTSGPYPFSQGFLSMQERRRKQKPPAMTHNRTVLQVDPEHWERLSQRDMNRLCTLTSAQPHPANGLVIHSLKDDLWVDPENRRLMLLKGTGWVLAEDPLRELITLLYLNNVNDFHPMGKDIVGPMDLKEAHYFKGKHALQLGPLIERYGYDLDGFRNAAEFLGGKPVEMGEAGFVLLPFPRVSLYYLFWAGDEEFKPKASVLFDRSIELILTASAIWTLVSMVSAALLNGPESRL